METTLIEIKQEKAGFEGFVGSWLCRGPIHLLIDVGPINTSRSLITSLDAMGIEEIEYILLTHIHIDHAGALAPLLDRFPMAQVVSHQKGLNHLADPSKLWAGSQKVLGDLAVMYGRPEPVDPRRLIPHTESVIPGLEIIETPGHAPHHLSFSYGGRLFSGEAAGNYLMVNGKEYLRPATPPRFFFQVFVESVNRLMALQDQTICYAHFGQASSSRHLLERFKEQLFRWKEIIWKEYQKGEQDLLLRCLEILLERDPELGSFQYMSPECQARERTFIMNAVKGFVGFFKENNL